MVKVLYCNKFGIINALAESLVIGGLPMKKKKVTVGSIGREILFLRKYLEIVYRNRLAFDFSKEKMKIRLKDDDIYRNGDISLAIMDFKKNYFDCSPDTKAEKIAESINKECEKFDKYIERGIKLGKVPTGSGHNCMYKGVGFNMIIEFPLYWLKEYQRYNFTDIISSQSTMHKILEFDLRDMFTDEVDERSIAIIEDLKEQYNNETDVEKKKKIWRKIINTCPDGLHMCMGITMNYLQASSIIKQREHHKLSEWSEDFVPFLKELPFYEFFLG